MDIETFECTASVWPHRHKDEHLGPLDIMVSFSNQPTIVREWPKGRIIKVFLEQPNPKTNLTFIQLGFDFLKMKGHWHNINQCRVRRNQGAKFYLRSRIVNQMKHPVPRGRWSGECQHTDKWCLYTFQAVTMKVKSNIILPEGVVIP